MNFEERCLAIVRDVTRIQARFVNGTLFLATEDSEIAVRVYRALSVNNQSLGITYGSNGAGETFYDFV